MGIGIATAYISLGLLILFLSLGDSGQPSSFTPKFTPAELLLNILAVTIMGVSYGLCASTWFWILVRRRCPEAFSSDWVVKKPKTKIVILIPFAVAFLIWLWLEANM